MRPARISIAVVLAVGLAGLLFAASGARGVDVGDVLKIGGIAYLVDRYDEEIDSFITSALGQRDAAARGATKVVPILSLGGGGYVGAAQIVGSPENVQRVKAVVQVESKFGDFRAKVLVPTTIEKASGTPDRAKGVGVSAVVEFAV